MMVWNGKMVVAVHQDGEQDSPAITFSNDPVGAELMDSSDLESFSSDRAFPAPNENSPQSTPTDRKSSEGTRRLMAFACVAALVAAAVSSVAGEVIMARYESDLFPSSKRIPPPEDMVRWRHARLYTALLTFTTTGGLLGLAMGLAGGLARRSASASARAAILGLVLGTATAGGIASILVPIFFKVVDPQSVSLVIPLLTQGAIWASIGAVSGLVFAVGLGGRSRWITTLVGGLVGAAAAAIVYEIVGALAFSSDHTDLPLSSSITTRGMAQLLVATFSAIGAVLALHQSPKKETPAVG
jgi:hypothetical protein